MWQKAKRAVSAETARAIAEVARQGGAKAVGVFVDEDAASISQRYVVLCRKPFPACLDPKYHDCLQVVTHCNVLVVRAGHGTWGRG